MSRHPLVLACGVLIAGVLMVAGFGLAYEIYVSQENCQEMDVKRNITANCWAFPNGFLVAGGAILGLGGLGVLAVTLRRYRNRTEQSPG